LTSYQTKQPLALKDVQDVLVILHHITSDLSEKTYNGLLVPDIHGILRPINSTYYVNFGSVTPAGTFAAHRGINQGLADKLGMKSLGVSLLKNLSSSQAFGEDLVKRIRSLLRDQYTDQQILSEFLANAVDAGAQTFGIAMNETQLPAGPISAFSAAMEPLLRSPSLVIHNDGLFTEDDWNGICDIGQGGKATRGNTIGRFGLGALTMFHLTEVGICAFS
jgi:hypothetical protein